MPLTRISSGVISNGTIATVDIADSAITTAKIAAGAVVTADIADSNVTAAKIADSAVTSAKIAAGAVGTANLSDSSVSTVKVADSAVTAAKIANSAVTPAKLSQPLTFATVQNSTSGTNIDFTGIPSWAKRITVMFNGVSTSGTSALQMQIGPSSGVETTGYGSSMTYIVNATPATSNISSGFLVGTMGAASNTHNGIATLCTLGGGVWVYACNLNDGLSARTLFGSGAKTITGVLDRVRVTTIGGTDTFDAGSINISYEG